MTSHYHINQEDEFITLRFDGEVDLVAVYELGRQLLEDATYRPDWPQLVDVRGISLLLQKGALKPFVHFFVNSYRPEVHAPMAVVLDGSTDAEFCAGVFRLACAVPNTEVFDDYALAIKWLVRNSAPHVDASAQPEDPRGYDADEKPEQIRA